MVDHTFEPAEITMFSDAVQASKLTEGHKARLIRKLGETVGEHQAESIEQNLVFCDMPKRSNSNILFYIDLISKAITKKKKVSFRYYSLDENKEKVFRKGGKRYIVNPLVMVWNKDNYYLMTYHDRYDGLTNYRIDHMDDEQIEETPRTERAEYADFKTEEYRKQVFSINEFVEKILVHAPDRLTGERTQEVEIYLNFIGQIDIPVPEPTPEELEQMRKDQYWKDKYRRFKDYELARCKKKLQERKAKEAEEFAKRQAEKIAVLTEELRENPPEMPFVTRQVQRDNLFSSRKS